jgi:hypothetical protein
VHCMVCGVQVHCSHSTLFLCMYGRESLKCQIDFIIALLNLRTWEVCYAKIARRTMDFRKEC